MDSRRATALALTLAALLAAESAGAAEPLGPGDTLPALTLPDQHGETHEVDAAVRLVMLSRDMDGGGAVREVLEDAGRALLERHGAVYVADVSRMPGVIRSLVAKPRMRRRPYPVLLDEEGAATASLPSREGHATLIFLDDRRITRVELVDSPEALRKALGEPEPPVE